MDRNTIFISHATPQDNDFVRWLGSRLTGHGYKVWADLFELQGGTPFWKSIEEALRNKAIKVIYVASRTSIDPARNGVRNELSVADTLRTQLKDQEFIIPVRIDDAPFGEFPIQVHQLNAIDFSDGWGPKLVDLLDQLERSKVHRTDGDQTEQFEAWRNAFEQAKMRVEVKPEKVVTNLLPILHLPREIGVFEYDGDNKKIDSAIRAMAVPAAMFFRNIVSFAGLDALQGSLSPSFRVKALARFPLEKFLAKETREVTTPAPDEARKMVVGLLRRHVEHYLEQRGLKRFDTSSGTAFFIPKDLLPGDRVSYVAPSGKKTYKTLVGRSEKNLVFWHLAVKVNLTLDDPSTVRFKPYVCFSEDGVHALTDPKRTSRIRRRFCKNWWNRHWRQLQQAFSQFLADGKDQIQMPLDGPETLVLSGELIELAAERSMPSDLEFSDEPEDPAEPEDELEDDAADSFNPEDSE